MTAANASPRNIHRIACKVLRGMLAGGSATASVLSEPIDRMTDAIYSRFVDTGASADKRHVLIFTDEGDISLAQTTKDFLTAKPHPLRRGINLRGASTAMAVLFKWCAAPHVYVVDETLSATLDASKAAFGHDGAAMCPAPAAMVVLHDPGGGHRIPLFIASEAPGHAVALCGEFLTLVGLGPVATQPEETTLGQSLAALFSALASERVVEAEPIARTKKQRRRDAKAAASPMVQILRVRVPEMTREVVRRSPTGGADGPGRRSPRPHLVLPHAHRYWVGSGDDRHLEPRWLEAYWKGSGPVEPAIKIAKGV